jgi:hypothetical protein
MIGVVSKALGWVNHPDLVLPDDRLRKPFVTKRHKSDKVFILKAPRFRLDPKNAVSAEPVESVGMEFSLIEDSRIKKLDTGVSTEEDFSFPPTVIHLRTDDGCQAGIESITVPENSLHPSKTQEDSVVRLDSLNGDRRSVEKPPPTATDEPDVVRSKLFNPLMLPEPGPNMLNQGGSFKFTLPPMKRKREPNQRKQARLEQLRSRKVSFSALAAAVLIQQSWRRYTRERKKGLSRLVHRLFDDYFTKRRAESPAVPIDPPSIRSPLRFVYNSRS